MGVTTKSGVQAPGHSRETSGPYASAALIRQFIERIRTQEGRRLFGTLFLGKMVGLAAIFLGIKGISALLGGAAGAAGLPHQTATAVDVVNPLNTVLATAFQEHGGPAYHFEFGRWDAAPAGTESD